MGDFNIANVRFKIDTVLGGNPPGPRGWWGGVSVLILDQTGLINNLDKDRKYRVLVTDLKEMGIMDKSLISYNLNRESIEKNNF